MTRISRSIASTVALLAALICGGPAKAGHYDSNPARAGHYDSNPARAGHYDSSTAKGGLYDRGNAAGGPVVAQPAPRSTKPLPFAVGEALTYDIAWAPFITAASATVTVTGRGPNGDYQMAAEGRPTALVEQLYRVFYRAETNVDGTTLLPLRGSILAEEGKRRRLKVTTFNQRARTARYTVQTTTTVTKDLRLSAPTHDALSAFYALRVAALQQAARLTIPICDSGETFDLAVEVVGRESVESGIGARESWKLSLRFLDAKKQPDTERPMTLWITTDAARVPVRAEARLSIGLFTLTLREARLGTP